MKTIEFLNYLFFIISAVFILYTVRDKKPLVFIGVCVAVVFVYATGGITIAESCKKPSAAAEYPELCTVSNK